MLAIILGVIAVIIIVGAFTVLHKVLDKAKINKDKDPEFTVNP